MNLNADILYESLSKQFSVKRLGEIENSMVFRPPVFYYEGIEYENYRVYVGRAGEFPPPKDNITCIIICVGGGLPARWRSDRTCVLTVMDETNILRIFNYLQLTYDCYDQWSNKLREILAATADIEEMIRITAPILGVPITFLNNCLEIVAYSNPDGDNLQIIGPLPENRIQQFIKNHKQNTSMREPFFYEMGGRICYCINLYKQDVYRGMASFGSNIGSFNPGELALFNYFFKFLSVAAEKHINNVRYSFPTIKSVFHDLLEGLPVSSKRIQTALKSEPQGVRWFCIAVKPGGNSEKLPTEYLCTLLESHLAKSMAIFASPYIAVFLPVQENETSATISCSEIEMLLKEYSMRAGASYVFEDIYKAPFFLRQAINAIETATELVRGDILCHFRDFALLYALRNSVGELSPEYMLPEGLVRLWEKDNKPGGTDYLKTLRIYLNNEMNVTQTARDLFIHRSTLMTRLNKINEIVDLSTPYRRMYIRYCLYLQEICESLTD